MGLKDFFDNLKGKGEAVTREAARKLGASKDPATGGPANPPADDLSSGPVGPPPPPARPSLGSVPQIPGSSRGPASPQAIPQRVDNSTGVPRGPKAPGPVGRSGTGPLEIANPDDSVYARRTGLVSEVEERFSRFGPKVCSYLLTQFMLPSGARRVAEKLGLTSRNYDSGDRHQIEQWLDRNGSEEFCRIIGIRIGPPVPNAPQPIAGSSSDPIRVRTIQQRIGSLEEPPTAGLGPPPPPAPIPPSPNTPAKPPIAGAGPGAVMPRPRPQPMSPSGQPIAGGTPGPGVVATTPPGANAAPTSPRPTPPRPVGITPVPLSADAERRTQLTKAPAKISDSTQKTPGPTDTQGRPVTPSPTDTQRRIAAASPTDSQRVAGTGPVPPPPPAPIVPARPVPPPPADPATGSTPPPAPPVEQARDILMNALLDDSSRIERPRSNNP